MRVQTQTSYTTIPKKALLDTSLSLRAKGFYACMMSGIDVEDENAFKELLENGYIELKKNEYVLLISPIIKKEKVEDVSDMPFYTEPSKKLKTKKKPLPQVITECVNAFTTDENERTQLMRYFNLRLNPPEDSKFYGNRLKGKQQVINALNSLNDCPTRIESIIQSIDKGWMKFYPYHKNNYIKSRDNTVSSSFTEEELLNIKSTKETF